MTDAPDTVTEAMALLESEGYGEDFDLRADAMVCGACAHPTPLEVARIDQVFRFEGDSDPADEMIVIGVSCPACGAKGILVSAYGHDADPEHAAALRRLATAL